MSSLPDAERDARDVVQVMAGLATVLRAAAGGCALPEHTRGTVLRLVEDGEESAARVVAYLRSLRGAGDGEAVAVPPRLGIWRDWVPPRGDLLGTTGPSPRDLGPMGEMLRHEPGE